jgi:histidinol-phosphate aminotransferase
MKSVQDFIVPWVLNSEPYSAKHMDVAWENPEVVRMMSNENLLPPSEGVIDAVLEAARMGNFYPGSGPELRKKLGEKAGMSSDNVVLGNGSTDVIDFVISTFIAPGEDVLMAIPTFPMYEARTRLRGGTPIQVPMTPNFYWDIDAMLAAVSPKTKLIFICSPNNPTGNQIAESDLRRILDLGIPTFFDEAYFEYEDEVKTRAPLIKEYPLMMINRTFSKAYGLAGFRLGYLLCDVELANYFNRVKISWNVSLIALAAALAGVNDEDDLEKKRKITIEGRNYIFNEINKIPGLRAFPSEGNFVLIDADSLGFSSGEIRERMAKKGIFIRPMSGHNMGSGFIRITIGTPKQNRMFLKLFKELVDESNSKK